MKRLVSILFFITAVAAHAQIPDPLPDSLYFEDDTLKIHYLRTVTVTPLPDFEDAEARRQYYILRNKVLKVYPYALIAARDLEEVDNNVAAMDKKRKQNKYIKQREEEARKQYKEELKQLTRSEGQILMKLIHRETGETSYEVVKRLRGGFNAFMYQSIAGFYDSDMKKKYDPENNREDWLIENILLRSFEDGTLTPSSKR
jgi:hypothetical protein